MGFRICQLVLYIVKTWFFFEKISKNQVREPSSKHVCIFPKIKTENRMEIIEAKPKMDDKKYKFWTQWNIQLS